MERTFDVTFVVKVSVPLYDNEEYNEDMLIDRAVFTAEANGVSEYIHNENFECIEEYLGE